MIEVHLVLVDSASDQTESLLNGNLKEMVIKNNINSDVSFDEQSVEGRHIEYAEADLEVT